MLITLKADLRPPTAPILGSPTVLSTTSISVPLQTAATDVNGIASYSLEYSTSINGAYFEATSAAVFPQVVSGLDPSTQYFFRSRAVDNYGNAGPYSGIVSATTQAVNPGSSLSWPAHVPGYVSLIPEVGGYGMNAVAGSGRHLSTPATTIILVNSLGTGNTGSAATGLGANVFQGTWEYAWRHAASPKVIIPIVSGWVPIQDSVPCQTGTPPRPGYVSYYGQFAPNPGLFLRGANVALNGASNVAVWHLRSYMGDDVTGVAASGRDCLSSGYGGGVTQQIVLINCEFAWSVDELVDFYRSHNQLTLLNCAFIEPLHLSTVIHPEDGAGVDHGFGPIIGGDTGQAQPSAVSCFRNLWAHTTGRNPLISAETFVHANNLHYNHGRPTVGAGNGVQIIGNGASAANFANILGNGFVRGPNNSSSFVAVSVSSSMPAGSAGYSFANAQFGWTSPSSQNAFFTSSPTGYAASAVQSSAYPGSWGTGLTAVLQWATNPLAPTLTEWHNFVTLMDRTVGAQPRWRTAQYGRVDLVFDQIRDRLNGVTQTDQFVDTVTEAGGWFTVPSVTINPLNPGSHWRAPLPTGSDRDTPHTSGTFSDGKSRIGYTRLEEWAYEQHLFVTSVDTVAPSVPAGVSASTLSSASIRITWSASADVGGVGVAGYRVYRSTSSGGPFSQTGSDVSVGTLSFDDSGLNSGTTYYYRVSAFDWSGNESNASTVTNATTSSSGIARLPFTDGFEGGISNGWAVGGIVTLSTTESYSGTRSASTLAVNGQQSDNYLEYNFGDEPSVGGTPTGSNDLWIQFAHKWDSAYVDSDPNIIAQKLLLINFQNPATGRRRYQVTFNIQNATQQYFFDLYRWNEDTSFGGTLHFLPIPFTRVKGRWEEFVFRLRMNTPGQSNGQLDCWTKAAGQTSYTQQLSRADLNYRDATAFTPNRLIGLSNYDTLTTRSGLRYWDSIYIGQTAVDVSQSAAWADTTVGYSQMPAQLSGVDGRKVRMDVSGTDWGALVDDINGASVTRVSGGAYDGTDAIRIVPPSSQVNNGNKTTYSCIMRDLDISNNGAKNVAQTNLGVVIQWGSRYIDLAATAKITGILAAQTQGGAPNASASRAGWFETTWNGSRIFSVTATTVASYHQPVSGIFPDSGTDPNKLCFVGTTINHSADPPRLGQEWLYIEQEVDYRRNRGNPDGRNRIDIWSRTGYIGYMEIALTHRSLGGGAWDFTYQFGSRIEYIGGLWNNPSTANANNFLIVSHPIVAVNRAKDARIGPPPGFLT